MQKANLLELLMQGTRNYFVKVPIQEYKETIEYFYNEYQFKFIWS